MKGPSFVLYRRTGWQPRVDVYRCNEGWLVKAELAGVTIQDIRIEVAGDSLIIEGRRRDWCVPNTIESLSMEITYDWFQRSIQLPDVILAEDIRTDYREGMLLIYLSNKS
jgi:HSP20 family protein